MTPWTVAYNAPTSMGFSRQEYWSGLPFPSPEDLLNPEIKPGSPACRQMLYHLSHQGSPYGEGGMLQTNNTGMCGECSQCLDHTGFPPAHPVCAFPVYTAQAPSCSARELSKEGPGLGALPRSKPLRFRFPGTPYRHRLGWACVLCPSQV